MSKFFTEVCSDVDYEGLSVDLHYENNIVMSLICDQGIDKPEVIIYHNEEFKGIWRLPLKDFMQSLDLANKRLIEVNQAPLKSDD